MLTCLWFPAVSLAASFDPDLSWRTLRTEHFQIHFHQGIEQVADELSQQVERIYATMSEEVRWSPRNPIHVVLVDRTDDANGFASAVPYNHITLYVTAPTPESSLQLYEDWNEALFTHELTHILHIDTNEGMVHAARKVVGRVASSNDVSPAWMVEGFATFQETRHTAGGRGRAAYPDMIKRTAVLEDAFPPLGNLDGFQPQLPSGNLRYLFGQDFIQHVADRAGEDAWTTWVHRYGAWWTPGFFLPTRQVFGRSLRSWYQDWRDAETAKYTAQAAEIRARGESGGRVVSDPAASCGSPSFSPDALHLVWSCYDVRTGSALWISDDQGFGGEVLQQDFGAGSFTWRADGESFVYSGAHLVNQFNLWDDIYLFDLDTRSVTPLTAGARARDPEFSPDGSRLLYVSNAAQQNQLEVLTVDRRRRPLTDHADHTQLSTPRFRPDGRALAVSVWRDGRRDLWLYSPEGEPLRRLTADAAIDQDPAWSRDGRWLLFGSDRDGVPNIYAIDTQAERLWQVTNVVTGAASPAIHPGGGLFAYERYSQDGWEVVVDRFDPATFRDRGALPRSVEHGPPLAELLGGPVEPLAQPGARFEPAPLPELRGRSLRAVDPFPALVADPARPLPPELPQSSETVDTFRDVRVKDAFGEEQEYPFLIRPRRYSPGRTLLPTYVLPYVQTTPFRPSPTFSPYTCLEAQTAAGPQELFCRGLAGSLSTAASDALRRYGWSASLGYRTDVDALGGGAAFTVNRWLPVYTVGFSSNASPSTQLTFVDPSSPTGTDGEPNLYVTDPPTYYVERRNTAYAVVSWPYQLRTTLFAQYSFSERRPRYEVPSNAVFDLLPAVGRVGTLSGGWRWAFSRPTPYAISVEDGRIASLVGSVVSPWLGTSLLDLQTGERSPFTQLQLTGELRQYVVVPRLPNHVIAGRAAGGLTFGSSDFFGNYFLGGSFGDGLGITPDEARMVRGYPYATDVGDLYWLGGLEYRFPLLRLERGAGTLPVYGRTLSMSLFADTGNAFVNPSLETGVPASAQELAEAAVEEPLLGVGAELVWRAVVFYGIGLDGRIGYAVSALGDGFTPTVTDPSGARVLSLAPVYLRMGGSF